MILSNGHDIIITVRTSFWRYYVTVFPLFLFTDPLFNAIFPSSLTSSLWLLASFIILFLPFRSSEIPSKYSFNNVSLVAWNPHQQFLVGSFLFYLSQGCLAFSFILNSLLTRLLSMLFFSVFIVFKYGLFLCPSLFEEALKSHNTFLLKLTLNTSYYLFTWPIFSTYSSLKYK